MIKVEIVFAPEAQQVWRKTVDIPDGATLEHALVGSGFYQEHGQQWHNTPCGVFGVQRERDYRLSEGDQVEVYRPLVFDPMESRRRRAAHRKRQRQQTQKNN